MAVSHLLLPVLTAVYLGVYGAAVTGQEQPLTDMAALAQSPVRTDACVQKCPGFGPDSGAHVQAVFLLRQYCGSVQCLRGERSEDGQQSCLDRVLDPSLVEVCELGTDAREGCFRQLYTCSERSANNTRAAISAVDFERLPPTDERFQASQIASGLTVYSNLANVICEHRECIEEETGVCEVDADVLAGVIDGSPLAGQLASYIPGSLYCCLPRLLHVLLDKCLPDTLADVTSRGDVLEPVVGTELTRALRDSSADVSSIVRQLGRQITQPLTHDDLEKFSGDIKNVMDRFQNALQRGNITFEEIGRRLQDPDALKSVLGVLCDITISLPACVVESLEGEERCGDLWPYTKQGLHEVDTQIAKYKQAARADPDFSDENLSSPIYAVLLAFLEECPVQRIIAGVEEASSNAMNRRQANETGGLESSALTANDYGMTQVTIVTAIALLALINIR